MIQTKCFSSHDLNSLNNYINAWLIQSGNEIIHISHSSNAYINPSSHNSYKEYTALILYKTK